VRITLIHNPGAGDDRAPDGQTLVDLITRAGHEVAYQSAREPEWENALKGPADLVVAAGGDGTVGRVARRLIGRGVPMAAISLGTANNIARSLGVAGRSIEEQAVRWQHAHPSAIDAGEALGAWGRRVFIEGLGIGLFASLMSEGERLSVNIAIRTLREYLERQRARRITASLDGADISGEYLLFQVMNMQFIGPNLYLAPDGRPDDGRLDVVVIRRTERELLGAYLAAWEGGTLTPPRLPTVAGRSLIIGSGRHVVHLDDRLAPLDRAGGDPMQGRIEVNVLPGALLFLGAGPTNPADDAPNPELESGRKG
jgi:diacylglycerol kinase family enzyme